MNNTHTHTHTHTHHSIILSQTGHVYAFGDGRQGQLGLGSTSSMLVPTIVSPLHDHTIAKVICGSSHTMCLTEHGDVALAWGSNQCGQLGNGNGGVRYSLEPHPVDLSSLCGGGARRIEVLGCGPCANHTLLVTSGRLPWTMTRVLLAGALLGIHSEKSVYRGFVESIC
jgi:hypothetical protein